MYKKLLSLFVLLVLISSFVVGQEEFVPEDPYGDEETCVGFWGKTKCLLFGDPARRALVGEAGQLTEENKAKATPIYKEGKILFDQGKYDDAIAKFREADGIYPHPNNKYAIADSLQRLNRNDEALAVWKSYLDSNPDPVKYKDNVEYAMGIVGQPPAGVQQTQVQTPQQLTEGVNLFLQGAESTAATPTTPGAPAAAGAQPTSLPPDQQTALRTALGETIYKRYIGENGESFNQYTVSEGKLVKADGTTITMSKPDDDGFRTVSVATKDKEGKELKINRLTLNDQEIATQTNDGIEVLGKTVKLPAGKTIDSLKDGSFEFGKTADKLGGSVAVNSDSGEVLVFDYDDETRVVKNTKTGEIESTSGDYYPRGESDCKGSTGCYFADGGNMFIDENGNGKQDGGEPSYSVDYDFDGSGGEQQLSQKQYYNRKGNLVGTEKGGVRVLAKETDDGNIYELKEGDTVVNARKVGDNWVAVSSPRYITAQERAQKASDSFEKVAGELSSVYEKHKTIIEGYEGGESALRNADDSKLSEDQKKVKNELNQAYQTLNEADNEIGAANKELEDAGKSDEEAKALIDKNKENLGNAYSTTEGALATTQDVLESIYAVTSQMKQFPALSKLIFGDSEFYKEWTTGVDQAFAPLLGTNWFPSFCETDDRWADIEPEGKAVIKTVSGTFQAVASIQLERTGTRTPILCHKNPDEEADKQFICDKGQTCVDDSFCWRDQNGDGKPDRDEEGPMEGYFYKVTWSVSSPQDEALTPFIDENGVAVSFNIVLNPTAAPFGIRTAQSVPLYNRDGNIVSPIELRNGASDKDAIIKYSPNIYEEACIIWDKAPSTFRGQVGSARIPNVCFSAVTSEVGKVNWERSGQDGASVTGSKGEISRNTDW